MSAVEFDPLSFPTGSGVYLMKAADGSVLYVGKAKNLRSRLRSYFSRSGDGRVHIRFLMAKVCSIDTIVTDTEKEALILENTLIKKHRPRYNINLRDDKTYVSLRLDPQEEFPALSVVRKVKRDGALYFGPYASSGAVKATLKEIYRIFPLRHYPLAQCRKRKRPCLFFQIGQCSAPCFGHIGAAQYDELVKAVVALLSGRPSEVRQMLWRKMEEASASMRFEEAARLRDQIRDIDATVERQKVVEAGGGDMDVVGIHRQEGEVHLSLLFVRQGQLVDSRHYALRWRLDEDELLDGFLQEFYGREVLIPELILLPFEPASPDVLTEWLTERRGRKVQLSVPRRGPRLELVEMARKNALEAARRNRDERRRRLDALEDLRQRLGLSRLPKRMECFDISNVQGEYSVGSMSVVIEGEAAKDAYRRYRIRSVVGADDFASMQEVLRRRLCRGIDEDNLPDFILIDGGRGQLGAVEEVLGGLGLAGRIDLAGLAKSRVIANVRGRAVERSEERVFLPGRKNPVLLRQGSAALFMLERLRDEAHRFAIGYHRKLRGKAALHSELDEIEGIGEARRKLLIQTFGSLKNLRRASLEELQQVPGLPSEVARRLFEHFQPAVDTSSKA